MATETEALVLRLEANMARFENQLARAASTASKKLSLIETSARRMESSLASAGRGFVKAGAAMLAIDSGSALASGWFDAALMMDRVNKSLVVATGSAEAAKREFEFVRSVSESLGLELASAATQYASLAAASRGTALEGIATRDIFTGVAKAASALGLSASDTAGVLNAVQQMISKGVVSAEELRGQMGERLPGAFQAAANAMGMTTEQLGKQLELGNVTADDLLPKLAKELEKLGGAAGAQGLQGDLNRLNNQWTDLMIAFSNTGALDLASAGLRELAFQVRQFQSGGWSKFLGLIGSGDFQGAIGQATGARIEELGRRGVSEGGVKKSAYKTGGFITRSGYTEDAPSRPKPKPKGGGRSGAGRSSDASRSKEILEDGRAQIEALKVETQALGMAKDAATAFKFEKELLARASAQEVAITPQLTQSIAQLAEQYRLATTELEKKQSLEKADEFLADLSARTAALSVEAQALTMTGAEANKFLFVKQALAEADAQGVAKTPDVVAGIEQQGVAYAALTEKAEKARQAQADLADGMRSVQDAGIQAFEDLIFNARSFDDVMKGLLKSLASSALRNLILGGSGGLAGGLDSLAGRVFGRASGGPVNAGQLYRVNEGTQREYFMPRVPGRVGRAPQGGGGAMAVTIDLRGTTGDAALDAKVRAGVEAAVAISARNTRSSFGSMLSDHQLRRA